MADRQAQECATTVMDTFHMMMRAVRPEAHKKSVAGFSMQQFRALMTIERHEGASLSHLSERLGATLSATSKLVDGLVERGYIARGTNREDRRKVILTLTDTGKQAVASVRMEVISYLAEKLTSLSAGEQAMLGLAMELLRSAITAGKREEYADSSLRSE